MNDCSTNGTNRLTRFLGLAASFATAASLILGCSGNVSSVSTTGIAGTAVSVPVMITDAPSDQLVAFTLTLNSIVLTNSAGKTVSILATPTTIEVCHLNGVQEALITASIPQDTYVSAAFTYSNPQITYINNAGAPVSVTPTLATTSYTATFASPITISNSSTSLLVDLLASQSVAISGTTVTVSPVFMVKPVSSSATGSMSGHNGTGMEQHGTVVSASGTTLVIQPPSGSNVTFTTSSSTIYQGVSSLSGLAAGQLVEVDFSVQTGGVLLATRVELEPQPPTGQPQNRLNGPVTAVTTGSNSFKMALMQGFGTAVSPTATGNIYTVNFTTSTVFAAAPQFASLTGLPFAPTFTAATLKAGQAVGVTASSITGTTATATNVYLIPQTLSGTVSAITTSGSWKVYTLTLTSGSAFATLSGATTVTVYTNGATTPMATSTIAVGSTLRFNGLVFNNGGSFAMVAGCSPDGDPSH
jgi:hypothetical protein